LLRNQDIIDHLAWLGMKPPNRISIAVGGKIKRTEIAVTFLPQKGQLCSLQFPEDHDWHRTGLTVTATPFCALLAHCPDD
jgi:hypothetical protein